MCILFALLIRYLCDVTVHYNRESELPEHAKGNYTGPESPADGSAKDDTGGGGKGGSIDTSS